MVWQTRCGNTGGSAQSARGVPTVDAPAPRLVQIVSLNLASLIIVLC